MYFRTHHAANDMQRSSKKLQEYFRSTESTPVDWKVISDAIGIDRPGLENIDQASGREALEASGVAGP